MQHSARAAVLLTVLSLTSLGAQETPDVRTTTAAQTYVGALYSYQSFFGDIDAWHLGSVSIGRKTSAGSLIGRVNRARRFAKDGTQFEVDAYPRLGDGVYAYVNVGYSNATIFPEWRSGAEIFASLPAAYEASAGYRQLRFDGEPVTLFTGSVGKYQGNYWFSLRPYLRSKTGGTSASASLLARRYFEDSDHYIGGRIGFGSTPSDQLVLDQASTRTNSFTAGLQGSTSVARALLGTWSAVYEREQLTTTRTRKSIALDIGARVLF